MQDYSNYRYSDMLYKETGSRKAHYINELNESGNDNKEIELIKILKAIALGGMSVQQAVSQLQVLGIEIQEHLGGNNVTFTFEYKGKHYHLSAVKNKTFEDTIKEYDADYIVDFFQGNLNGQFNEDVNNSPMFVDLVYFVKEISNTGVGGELRNLIGGRSIEDLVKALWKEVPIGAYTTNRGFIETFRNTLSDIVTKNPNRINELYQKIENEKRAEQERLAAEAAEKARLAAEAAERQRIDGLCQEATRLTNGVQSFAQGIINGTATELTDSQINQRNSFNNEIQNMLNKLEPDKANNNIQAVIASLVNARAALNNGVDSAINNRKIAADEAAEAAKAAETAEQGRIDGLCQEATRLTNGVQSFAQGIINGTATELTDSQINQRNSFNNEIQNMLNKLEPDKANNNIQAVIASLVNARAALNNGVDSAINNRKTTADEAAEAAKAAETAEQGRINGLCQEATRLTNGVQSFAQGIINGTATELTDSQINQRNSFNNEIQNMLNKLEPDKANNNIQAVIASLVNARAALNNGVDSAINNRKTAADEAAEAADKQQNTNDSAKDVDNPEVNNEPNINPAEIDDFKNDADALTKEVHNYTQPILSDESILELTEEQINKRDELNIKIENVLSKLKENNSNDNLKNIIDKLENAKSELDRIDTVLNERNSAEEITDRFIACTRGGAADDEPIEVTDEDIEVFLETFEGIFKTIQPSAPNYNEVTQDFVDTIARYSNDSFLRFCSLLYDGNYDNIKTTLYNAQVNISNLKDKLQNIVHENSINDIENLLSYGEADFSKIINIGHVTELIANNPSENNIWNADGILYNVDTFQGEAGDCWLLSFGISASDEKMAEFNEYYNSLIKIDNENQTYSITLAGITYMYTFDEIKNATGLSSGDTDVRVFEMAMREKFPDGFVNGGNLKEAVTLLCGKDISTIWNISGDATEDIWNRIFSHIKSGSFIMQVSLLPDLLPEGYESAEILDEKTGELIKVYNEHAYSLAGMDDEYVFLVNPHDSSKTIKMPIKMFKKYFVIEEVEVSTLVDAMKEANGEVIDQDTTGAIIKPPSKLDEGFTDSKGTHWLKLEDCIIAHELELPVEDYYNYYSINQDDIDKWGLAGVVKLGNKDYTGETWTDKFGIEHRGNREDWEKYAQELGFHSTEEMLTWYAREKGYNNYPEYLQNYDRPPLQTPPTDNNSNPKDEEETVELPVTGSFTTKDGTEVLILGEEQSEKLANGCTSTTMKVQLPDGSIAEITYVTTPDGKPVSQKTVKSLYNRSIVETETINFDQQGNITDKVVRRDYPMSPNGSYEIGYFDYENGNFKLKTVKNCDRDGTIYTTTSYQYDPVTGAFTSRITEGIQNGLPTVVTVRADGTVIKKVTNPDGTITNTTTNPDGSDITTNCDRSGNPISTTINNGQGTQETFILSNYINSDGTYDSQGIVAFWQQYNQVVTFSNQLRINAFLNFYNYAKNEGCSWSEWYAAIQNDNFDYYFWYSYGNTNMGSNTSGGGGGNGGGGNNGHQNFDAYGHGTWETFRDWTWAPGQHGGLSAAMINSGLYNNGGGGSNY